METLSIFGVCPRCGFTDGLVSIGRERWYVCHQDETKWLIGTNFYDTPDELRELNEATSPEDEALLETYIEVKPVHSRMENAP